MATARRPAAAASGTRPRLAKITDCNPRQSTSARDGARSPRASMIAAYRCSAWCRSAASNADWASQRCAAHHPSLPGSASSRSSGSCPSTRPRSIHQSPSAVTSRAAASRSCSTAQASTGPIMASSASSHRAAADSPVVVRTPAPACSATRTAYRASAACARSCSPAWASRPAPYPRSISSIAYRDLPSGPGRGGTSSEQSTSRSTTGVASWPVTASAASRVNGPGNTDRWRNTRRSSSSSSW